MCAQARIGIGAASVAEIDRINILQASLLAMRRAVLRLGCLPDMALIDGKHAPELPCPVETIVDGDALVPAISAASIVAKVTRDRLMRRLATRYPGYGWETNVGYATSAHREAIWQLGACCHHRRSFAAVQGTLFLDAGGRAGRSAGWPLPAAGARRLSALGVGGNGGAEPRGGRTTRAVWARSAARRRAAGARRSSGSA